MVHTVYENAPGLEAVFMSKRHFIAYTEASLLSILGIEGSIGTIRGCTGWRTHRKVPECDIEREASTYIVVLCCEPASAQRGMQVHSEGAD
jgi:hypothetical protein